MSTNYYQLREPFTGLSFMDFGQRVRVAIRIKGRYAGRLWVDPGGERALALAMADRDHVVMHSHSSSPSRGTVVMEHIDGLPCELLGYEDEKRKRPPEPRPGLPHSIKWPRGT